MKTTQPPTPAAHCASMLARARADMASECARRGPAGALARAVLRLVEMLITLLADFRAGPLAVPEPRASANAGAAGAEGEANPLPHNERRITQAPLRAGSDRARRVGTPRPRELGGVDQARARTGGKAARRRTHWPGLPSAPHVRLAAGGGRRVLDCRRWHARDGPDSKRGLRALKLCTRISL